MKVVNVKPKNQVVLDVKSKNAKVFGETQVYVESRTINAGEPMGLLLALTYPNTFTFSAPRA